jgi:hypothetical protein
MTDEQATTETTPSSAVDSGEGTVTNPTVSAPDSAETEDSILDKIFEDDNNEQTRTPEPILTGATTEEEVVDDEREGLLRALRRDGVPQTIIDQVSKDPEILDQWANTALKRQSHVDGYTEKMKELEDQLFSQGEQTPEDRKVSEQTDAEESEVGNNSLDALTDEIGEDAVLPIREMQHQLTEMKQQLDDANRRVAESELRVRLEEASNSVLGKWDITEEKRDAVILRMSELGKTKPGTFESIEALMHQAATEVLGQPKAKTRRSATPSPPSRVARLDRPTDVDSREDAALEVLLSGGSVDQAKQAAMHKS